MINKNHDQNQLMTRKEASNFLGVKENTLAVWATNKRYNLRFYKVGRLVKYRQKDLEMFLMSNANIGEENG